MAETNKKPKTKAKLKIDKFQMFSAFAWLFFLGALAADFYFLKGVRAQIVAQEPAALTSHIIKIEQFGLKKAVDRYSGALFYTYTPTGTMPDPFAPNIQISTPGSGF